MKRIFCFLLTGILALLLSACSSAENRQLPKTASIEQTILPPRVKQTSTTDDGRTEVQIAVGDTIFSAELYDNQATDAFLEQLPLTITMDELNGNEKFYYLPSSLPTDSHKPEEIKAGDLMLYGSDCLVLFYQSFSTSYSYTSLGFIKDVSGLSDALGKGSISITLKQK